MANGVNLQADTDDFTTWIDRKRAAGRYSYALRKWEDGLVQAHPVQEDASASCGNRLCTRCEHLGAECQCCSREHPAREAASKLALSLASCGHVLITGHTGDGKRKIARVFACGHRLCPRCAPMISAESRKIYREALAPLFKKERKLKALDLTLTLENCEWSDLRDTIKLLQKAFAALLGYAALKGVVIGALRAIEITEGQDGLAHPHIHAILLVPISYGTKKGRYIPQSGAVKWVGGEEREPLRIGKFAGPWTPVKAVQEEGWVELWQRALGVSYRPGAYIKAAGRGRDALHAVGHALKYALKPPVQLSAAKGKGAKASGGSIDGEKLAWMAHAIKGRRLVECYGLIRDAVGDLDDEAVSEAEEDEEVKLPEVLELHKWQRTAGGKAEYVVIKTIVGAVDWLSVRDQWSEHWPWQPFERDYAVAKAAGKPPPERPKKPVANGWRWQPGAWTPARCARWRDLDDVGKRELTTWIMAEVDKPYPSELPA